MQKVTWCSRQLSGGTWERLLCPPEVGDGAAGCSRALGTDTAPSDHSHPGKVSPTRGRCHPAWGCSPRRAGGGRAVPREAALTQPGVVVSGEQQQALWARQSTGVGAALAPPSSRGHLGARLPQWDARRAGAAPGTGGQVPTLAVVGWAGQQGWQKLLVNRLSSVILIELRWPCIKINPL